MKRSLLNKIIISFFIGFAFFANSSDFKFRGQIINSHYVGPILVHNSQFSYPTIEKLTFSTKDYLTQNVPNLLPLTEAIDTWSAINSIHPKLLSEVVSDYFKENKIEASFDNKQAIFNISSVLNTSFRDSIKTSLSASKALDTVAKTFNFEINLPVEFQKQKTSLNHDYFKGSNGPPLYSYFQPPWLRGETWTGGGVHTNTGGGSGDRNALDFWKIFVEWDGDTSDHWVAASQSGIARVFSSCFVTVIHPNGWESSYYHLDNVQVSDMQNVSSGQPLSIYANTLNQALCQGGSSSGPHIHFAVKYNGNPVEIDEPNLDFTSWKHKAGVENYDFNCNTSYYTLLPSNSKICPGFRQLPNNTTAENLIYKNGFEG